MPLRRTVVSRHEVADDLEIHVCTVEVDGLAAVDIRNYTPSAKAYGHGILFPADLTKAIRAALGKAQA